MCTREGRAVAATEVDHIVPFRSGGEVDTGLQFDEANLQSLCRACHQLKSNSESQAAARRAREGKGSS
jgi:5-methylcytosine-specific restriction endonuclease McrA